MNGKITRIIVCATGCICIAALVAFAACLPQTNRRGVNAVVLSRASGFYDEAFDLEMQFDGEIYYTLDSSDPDVGDTRYEGPIRISDASENPNIYSRYLDLSLEYHEDLLAHSGQEPHYGFKIPEEPIDKATVVRAVGIDAEGNRSDIVTGVYFVGYKEKTGYEGFGIIAITTDPKNLFDPETGIYVLGNKFSETLVDGYYKKKTSTLFEGWPANYRQRGRDWEREASICCFDADRNLVFSGNYGIRVQGKLARGMLPRSLNIFARKDYGWDTIPAEKLFGVNWQLGSVNLHAGAHTLRTKVRDYLVNTLTSDMNFDTRVYKPYQMFLDGEYWGVYWMTPRYEKEYFQYKYDVNGDDVIVIKGEEIEVGEEEDMELYDDMETFISDNDMTDPEMYARACEMIDIDSCVDYYATEIYIANSDWPHVNKAMWRTRKTTGSGYSDGRWRCILFDVNLSMSPNKVKKDFFERATSRDEVFASLMKNADFSEAIYSKLVELAEGRFNPSRMETFFHDYEAFMLDAMENEYARFYNGEKTGDDFIRWTERLLKFYKKRYAYIIETYGEGRMGNAG